MHQKDAEGIANSVAPDQTAPLIWVCIVCQVLSVRKLRKITVRYKTINNTKHQFLFFFFFFCDWCYAIQHSASIRVLQRMWRNATIVSSTRNYAIQRRVFAVVVVVVVCFVFFLRRDIWAATWQNQQRDCAPSEDSDQPGHPPSLIRVFTVRLMAS